MKELTDHEKDKLVERIISTNEGRKWLIDLAIQKGALKELGEAIITSIKQMENVYKSITSD